MSGIGTFMVTVNGILDPMGNVQQGLATVSVTTEWEGASLTLGMSSTLDTVLYTIDQDLPSTTWLDFIFFDHSKSEKHCIWTDTQFPSGEALTLLTDPVVSPCCVIITHTHTVSGFSFCFLRCGCVTIVDSHTMSVLSVTTSVNFLLWRSDNRHKFVTILCLYLV